MRTLLRRRRLPPDCREVADVLQAFLDGELGPSQTDLVASHLEHCARCGIDADVYRRVKRTLAALGRPSDEAALARLRAFADHLPHDPAG